MALEAAWGGRYRHMRALGNVNYRWADAPILQANLETGIRWAVERLRVGYSLILLCARKDDDRCHRNLVEEPIKQTFKRTGQMDDSI